MRLYDLICETTQQDISITVLARVVADFIVDVYAPQMSRYISKNMESLSNSGDPQLDYAILSGKPIKNGYIDGYDIEELGTIYFDVGKIKDIVDFDTRDQVYNKLKSLNIRLSTYSLRQRFDDVGATILLNKKIVDVFAFFLSGSDSKKQIQSLLAHEFRHYLDHNLSKGKAEFYNSPSEEELSKMSKAQRDALDDEYLNNQTEANARYLQALDELIQRLDSGESDVNKMIFELISKYRLDKSKSNKQTRNFIKRALNVARELKV